MQRAPHKGALYFYAAGICLFFLSWHLPYHIPPWVSFQHELVATLGLLAIAIGVFLYGSVREGLKLSTATLFLLCLIPIPLLQLVVGTYYFPSDAWLSILYLAGLLIAFLTGKQLAYQYNQETLLEITSGLLITASLLSAFMALQQWLKVDYFGIWLMSQNPAVPPYANISQPNQLASLLLMGATSILYLFEKRRIGAPVATVAASLLFFCIVLATSRTSFLSLITIAALLFWYGSLIALRIKKPVILICIAIFMLLWAILPTLYDALLLAPPGESGSLATRTMNDTRFPMWLGFLDASLHGPLLGYGWNQSTYAQAIAAPFHSHTIAAQQTHNLVLDILVWNGPILGLIIVIGLLGWMFKLLKEKPDHIRVFQILLLVPIGVHSLLEYPHHYTYFLFPVGIIAGMLDNANTKERLSIPFLPIRAVVLVGFAMLGWLTMEYLKIETEFTDMRFEAMRYAPRTKTAIQPDLLFTGQLNHFIQFVKSEAHEDMSKQELQEMEAVAHRYLYSPALFRYAVALGLNHKYDEAHQELMLIRQIHTAERYAEAFDGWQIMAKQHPQLNTVELPLPLSEANHRNLARTH